MKRGIQCLLIGLVGCSTSGTSILIGEDAYPGTEPGAIIFLLKAPDRAFKQIALVEGTAATDDYFTKERTQAAAVNALRKEAARIGAHAILLTGKEARSYGQVSSGSTVVNPTTGFGTWTSFGFGWEKITIFGTAIRFTD